jgi:hypothetical protein
VVMCFKASLILPKAAWCSGSTLGSYYLLMEPSGPRIETESRYFFLPLIRTDLFTEPVNSC